MTPIREATLLAAVCALVYLTAASERIPFYTRGEPREGLVVREMLASGEWLVPARPEGELARKPPLYYWAAATASRVMPERPERALRLPSALLGDGRRARHLGDGAARLRPCGGSARRASCSRPRSSGCAPRPSHAST